MSIHEENPEGTRHIRENHVEQPDVEAISTYRTGYKCENTLEQSDSSVKLTTDEQHPEELEYTREDTIDQSDMKSVEEHSERTRYKSETFAEQHNADIDQENADNEDNDVTEYTYEDFIENPSALCVKQESLNQEHSEGAMYMCEDSGLQTQPEHREEKMQSTIASGNHARHKRRHEKDDRKHTGEAMLDKPFKCYTCNFRSKSSHSLAIHERKKHGEGQNGKIADPEKIFKCDICSYSSQFHGRLVTHRKTKHKKDGIQVKNQDLEKPFKCDWCDFRSDSWSKLSSHRRTHTGEKPYLCDLCGFSCASRSGLGGHKRNLHSSEKPFKCDICTFSAKYSTSLNIHKRMHTGEKPFMCDLCGFRTSRSNEFRKHKMTHSDEKPYKCDLCTFSTRQPYNLTVHKRTHNR